MVRLRRASVLEPRETNHETPAKAGKISLEYMYDIGPNIEDRGRWPRRFHGSSAQKKLLPNPSRKEAQTLRRKPKEESPNLLLPRKEAQTLRDPPRNGLPRPQHAALKLAQPLLLNTRAPQRHTVWCRCAGQGTTRGWW